MTRKRVGEGLLEAFSETCEVCRGRGVIVHSEPIELREHRSDEPSDEPRAPRKRSPRRPKAEEPETDAEGEARRREAATAMALVHRAAHHDEDGVIGSDSDGVIRSDSDGVIGSDSDGVAGAEFSPAGSVESAVETSVVIGGGLNGAGLSPATSGPTTRRCR